MSVNKFIAHFVCNLILLSPILSGPNYQNDLTEEILQKWSNEVFFSLPFFFQKEIPVKEIKYNIIMGNSVSAAGKNSADNLQPGLIRRKNGYEANIFLVSETNFNNPYFLKKEVQRKIGFLFGQIVDKKYKYSTYKTWHLINRWKTPFSDILTWKYSSGNQNQQGFVTPDAMTSPARDFIEFFSHYFVPDENFRNVPPDESIRCRLPAHTDFLENSISDMDSEFKSPVLKKNPVCTSFEKWAEIDKIDHIEIILASPSAVFVGSLFGHVFLRIVPPSEKTVDAISYTKTFGFVADSYGPIEADPLYAVKGILGDFRADLTYEPFQNFYSKYIIHENRSMTRYRLNISRTQIRKLMIRLWNIKNNGFYKYYFFSENCGSMLLDTVNSILPEKEQILYPNIQSSMPTSTMEGYYHAVTTGNQNLISENNTGFIGADEEFTSAYHEREKIWQMISRVLEKLNYNETNSLWHLLNSGKSHERSPGYEKLYQILRLHNEHSRILYQYLYTSSILENNLSLRKTVVNEKKNDEKRIHQIEQRLDKLYILLPDLLEDILRSIEFNLKKENLDKNQIIHKFNGFMEQSLSPAPEKRKKSYRELVQLVASLRPYLFKDTLINFDFFENRIREYIAARAYQKFDLRDILREDTFDKFLFADRTKILGNQPYLFESGETDLLYKSRDIEVTEPMLMLLHLRQKLKKEITDLPDISDWEPKKIKALDVIPVYHTGADSFSVRAFTSRLYLPSYGMSESVYGLLLESSLINEMLGEYRQFGFPYFCSMTVLKNQVRLGLTDKRENSFALTSRIFEYQILKPLTPVETNFLLNTGWDFFMDLKLHKNIKDEWSLQFQSGPGVLVNLFQFNFFQWYLNTGLRSEFIFRNHQNKAYSMSPLAEFPFFIELKTPLPGLKSGIDYFKIKPFLTTQYNFFEKQTFFFWGISGVFSIVISPSVKLHSLNPSKSNRLFIEWEITGSPVLIPEIFQQHMQFHISSGLRFN